MDGRLPWGQRTIWPAAGVGSSKSGGSASKRCATAGSLHVIVQSLSFGFGQGHHVSLAHAASLPPARLIVKSRVTEH
jgi:hypothetical protein